MNFKNFIVLSLFIFLTSCNTSKELTYAEELEKYAFVKSPDKIYFNILQLNDVYEIAPIQGGKFGGMARVETVHQQLLKESPNTLLVLAGDFLNPSLLGTLKVDGERVRGRQMVEVMNEMEFDLVAFGNHEFDLSYEHLQDRLNESNFEWLSSNVYHNVDGKNHYFQKVINGRKEPVNETYIREFSFGGTTLKIGFISVCLPSNPRDYVTYTDMYTEAERTYNELKSKTDFVIGLTHVQIDEDKKIAELLPNIPLIMGGHEHTNSYTEIGKTVITKADANAKSVYIHRFEYDPITKKLAFKSQLKTIGDHIDEEPKVAAVVAKWQETLKNRIKDVVPNPTEIVYKAKEPLDARDTPSRATQTNMGMLIAESMSLGFNNEVDCAIVNGGSIRLDDQLIGKVSAIDIFRVLPYGGSVFKVKLKGALLKEVLDFGEKASGTGAYLQRYNISKNEKQEWLIQNQVIDLNKIYNVATSDYLMKGFDIPFLKPSNKNVIDIYKPTSKELSFDIRKCVIELLKRK